MALASDKNQRKSAIKKTAEEKALENQSNGVSNAWGKNNELRIGLQVGIINGGLKGKQGAIVETPKPHTKVLKIALDGDTQIFEMNLTDFFSAPCQHHHD